MFRRNKIGEEAAASKKETMRPRRYDFKRCARCKYAVRYAEGTQLLEPDVAQVSF